MARRKTAFDQYVAKRMKSREFAEAYKRASIEIRAADELIRRLDEIRAANRISKAELARRTGIPAETIRKLFTAQDVNPTMNTFLRLSAGVGLNLELVKVT
jgi:DNA-binding phage protein